MTAKAHPILDFGDQARFNSVGHDESPLNPAVERVATPLQYIRVMARRLVSDHREIFGAGLAPHLVGLDFERDLLAFGKA